MGFIQILRTILGETRKIKPNYNWRFQDLETTPYLYGPDYIKSLIKEAKDDETLLILKKYLEKYDAYDSGTYKILFKVITKKLKENAEDLL